MTTIIEEGARAKTVELQMPSEVADDTATVTAAAYDVERRTSARLKPAVAELVALDILPPPSGNGAWIALVTLSGRAPHGGTLIALASNSDRFVVPEAVVVPEGASATSLELIQAGDVTATENITITATAGGTQRTAKIVLEPRRERRDAWRTSLRERLVAWFSPRPPVSLGISAGRIAGASSSTAVRRISLYTPELQLLAETEASSAAAPPVAYEYVWFNGTPVAMFNVLTNTTSFTFTDHLGTPILQTNAAATATWRAEYEPFGSIHHMRAGTPSDQPLRFPGQEAATEGVATDTYNIFRWYTAGWGRYTQADPIGLEGGDNLYQYALSNPIRVFDSAVALGVFNWKRRIR
jgi:RHS repeat-associated protein